MSKIKSLIQFIINVLVFIENIFIKPAKKVYEYCKPYLQWYGNLFSKYTHDKYGDFIYKKAVVMIVATLASIYIIIEAIIFTFDVAYYLSTRKEETIYLSDSVELEDGLWSAKGCPTRECNSENALYFRIKNTWFNNIWNIWHHGQIFLPDIVASSVPTGQSECNVISYGLRYRIFMIFNYYPQILNVECKFKNG